MVPLFRTRFARSTGIALLLLMSVAPAVAPATALADGSKLFITSAHENADDTATLPLQRGTSGGQTVYYVITDTSDGGLASSLGVNSSPKLANAAGTTAVQRITYNADGSVNFPSTVDFSRARAIVPNAAGTGFPPEAGTHSGPVGRPGYSPLIQLPNGTVVNAPQIANNSGQAAKIVGTPDVGHMKVTYRETHGFQGGKAVKYASFDASNPVAAALENATYAPALDAAPRAGDDSGDSSRATLVAFVNGQTGANNPQRQGLNSAILDGQDPLNVLRWNPSQGNNSPLWDVNLAQWTAVAIASGQRVRQTDVGTIQGLADHGLITGPGGTPFGASGFIVNCPIVSLQG